jgi:hypothetical protein
VRHHVEADLHRNWSLGGVTWRHSHGLAGAGSKTGVEVRMTMAWDEQWERLGASDVFPFPLAVETNYTGAGWRVNLIVVLDVTGGGYEAIKVSEYAEPYLQQGSNGEPDMSPSAAIAVRRRALAEFAQRLRRSLGAVPDQGDLARPHSQ